MMNLKDETLEMMAMICEENPRDWTPMSLQLYTEAVERLKSNQPKNDGCTTL